MSTDTSVRQTWQPLRQASSSENGTEKRESGFLEDADPLEKRSNHLTEEEAAEIVNAILVSTTEDPNEFSTELEHRIIPVGFGLSLGELIYPQYSAQNGTRKFNAAETGTQHAAGSRQVFSVRAKKVQHQVTPGFTTSGEEICYIQPLGKGRANFVVKSPDECYSLVDCSISGGPLAIEAAKNAGKPFTVSDEAKLKEYRELVTRGGQYGISFVAPGAWDASKKRMPFIVVGFYHVSAQDPNNTVEAAVSRSNLGKILKSPRQAEHMIVQCLGCESHWRLREALSFQFCMEAPLSATHINFPSQQPMAAPPNQPGPPNQQNHYYGGYSIPQRMAPEWNEQVPWWLQKPQQASHQFPTQETQSIPHQQPAGVYPQYMTEPVNWQQAFNYMSPAYQQQPFMMPYNPFHMVPQLQGLNPKQAIPQDLPSLGQPIQ
ncbi:hypothetical protein AKAW_06011 [Aspergillus luchuensis IFO 4308]|nr:hypothetical protein AKAW_06011 [Aspergillus luchuensis IFO 4308]